MKQLAKAIAIAATYFDDTVDRGGQPYILHCLRVMNSVKHLGEDYMCAAVLHDIVEDTEITISDLSTIHKFNNDICMAIYCLTHLNKDSYDDYIKKIATNKMATLIKLADLKDNSDITRLKGLRKKDFDRLEKYHKAYVYLSDIW